MSRIKLTNSIVDDRLKDRTIIRIGDYIDNKTKILFKCLIDNYEWYASPCHIMNSGSGCPLCSGLLPLNNKTFDIKLSNKNKEIIRMEEYINSTIPILFKCIVHNHTWKARPAKILYGNGCIKCRLKNQTRINNYLNERYGINNVKSQFIIHSNKRKYYIDFVVNNIFIKYNGQQHYEPVKFGGISQKRAEENFIKQQKRDKEIKDYCNENFIKLIEIPYWLSSDKEQYKLLENLTT